MASDKTTSISELKDKVRKFVDDRDWAKYHNPKDIAISISIEASELLELFQWVSERELKRVLKDPKKQIKVNEEVADIMIYCFSLANALNIDLSKAVFDKIEKNESKYPSEKVIGKYKKYTELRGE